MISQSPPIKFAQRGFAKVNPKLLEAKRRDFIVKTFHWPAKKVQRGLAVVNGLVYAIANKNGAVGYDDEGRKVIKRSVIQKLINQGVRTFKTSVEGLTKYIARWWSDAACSASTVRSMRDELAEMGLFKVTGCKKKSFAWTGLIDVDFMGLLILQEALENAWLKVHFKTLDDLPSHKGGFVRLCWNAAKHVLGREFNRIYAAKIKQPKQNAATYQQANRVKRFVPVFYENGVEMDVDRCDRNGVYYYVGWVDDYPVTESPQLEPNEEYAHCG